MRSEALDLWLESWAGDFGLASWAWGFWAPVAGGTENTSNIRTRHQENKKIGNHETEKPRNQKNQETKQNKKPRNHEPPDLPHI